jgi:hypothetical protein
MSDWLQWFDFIVDNPANFPVSNAGHQVATATTLQGQLDQLDAALASTGLLFQVPTGAVNGTNATFLLSEAPVNSQSVIPFVDGVSSNPSEFIVHQVSGEWAVTFNSGSIPAVGQVVIVAFMTSSSGVGVGGGIAAIENEPGGVGLFYENNVNVALLKSLVAGTNFDIVDNGNGTLTLSASGGGGGGIETHGTGASPISITPSVGIAPTSAAEQVWWIAPSSGSGSIPITASPAIAPGSTIGQILILKSTANSAFLVVPNGSGTDMDGNCSMGTFGQTLELMWDGANWSENSRRV